MRKCFIGLVVAPGSGRLVESRTFQTILNLPAGQIGLAAILRANHLHALSALLPIDTVWPVSGVVCEVDLGDHIDTVADAIRRLFHSRHLVRGFLSLNGSGIDRLCRSLGLSGNSARIRRHFLGSTDRLDVDTASSMAIATLNVRSRVSSACRRHTLVARTTLDVPLQ